VNRPRAADDFATIRARMKELRREQEGAHATEGELDQSGRSAPTPYWSRRETRAGPPRVRWPDTTRS
jgi:hypothetical protein